MYRQHHSLALSTTALLSIDFQRENSPGRRWSIDRYDALLSSAMAVMGAARRSGAHVIHCRTMRRSADRVPHWEPRIDGGTFLYGNADSPDAEFIPELAPMEGEIVIEKAASSAFAGTELRLVARRLMLTDLVVAGVWTEECVLLTVKDAIGLGFKVWLAAEACSSGSAATHQAATAIMAMRLYGGGVVGTKNAVACLEGQSFEAFSASLPTPLLTRGEGLEELYEQIIGAR